MSAPIITHHLSPYVAIQGSAAEVDRGRAQLAERTGASNVQKMHNAPSAPAGVEGLVRWTISHNGARKDSEGIWVMEQDAATALTALQAENERLTHDLKTATMLVDLKEERAEKAEAERDAIAAAAIKEAAKVARDCYLDKEAEADPGYIPKAIRALTPADAKVALDRMLEAAAPLVTVKPIFDERNLGLSAGSTRDSDQPEQGH